MTNRAMGLIMLSGLLTASLLSADQNVSSPQTGIPVVANPKVLASPDGRQRHLVFKEDLSIGVKEGDENYMFGQRVYFNMDEAGHIYVTDWDRKRIQKFGSDGKYLQSIGRAGQGPGEFHNVWTPEFDKEGNLYVVDIAQKRISFFSPAGSCLKQIAFPSIEVSGPLYFTASQNIVTTLTKLQMDDAAGSKWEAVIGLYDPGFHLLTEFGRSTGWSKPLAARSEDAIARSWADMMTDMAFAPSSFYALAPNGEIYYGDSRSYEIKVFSPEGKPARIIRKDYDPIPVTEADKDAFRENMKTEFLRFMPAQFEASKKKALHLIRFPKAKPAYKEFTVDDNGRLFVIADEQGKSAAVLDVFEPNGRWIMHFRVDIPVEGLRIKNKKAYAVAIAEDYRFVKRFTIDEIVR
jgi:hypothetical protein